MDMPQLTLPLVISPQVYETCADAARTLIRRGYAQVTDTREYRTGLRVNLVSRQYTTAKVNGVGAVVAIFEKTNSPWANKWGIPDVEVLVLLWNGTLRAFGLHHLEHCYTELVRHPE